MQPDAVAWEFCHGKALCYSIQVCVSCYLERLPLGETRRHNNMADKDADKDIVSWSKETKDQKQTPRKTREQ